MSETDRVRRLLETRLTMCEARTGGEGLFGPANQEAAYLRSDLTALGDPRTAGPILARYADDWLTTEVIDIDDVPETTSGVDPAQFETIVTLMDEWKTPVPDELHDRMATWAAIQWLHKHQQDVVLGPSIAWQAVKHATDHLEDDFHRYLRGTR